MEDITAMVHGHCQDSSSYTLFFVGGGEVVTGQKQHKLPTSIN